MPCPDAWTWYRGVSLPAGGFLRRSEVRISPNDRGFLFADGVYEVVRSYDGRIFSLPEHLRRLARSLDAVAIRFDDLAGLAPVFPELLARNDLLAGDATIYVQVTRGVCPRCHQFPAEPTLPTVYAETARVVIPRAEHEQGIAAITVPDNRWGRVDIKSISLLPNVLARQRAIEAGAYEAIFVRDGVVTEGTHTNVCGVLDGAIVTHALTNRILDGITRATVMRLARDLCLAVHETCLFEAQLPQLTELFLVGTTVEVMPVIAVNGCPVGSGRPGPVTRQLQAAFHARVRA